MFSLNASRFERSSRKRMSYQTGLIADDTDKDGGCV